MEIGEENLWIAALEECKKECGEAAARFLEKACEEADTCWKPRRPSARRYSWVKKLIDSGVPDGRARLILYVISRYLVNVLGLDEEDAVQEITAFIENSCQKHSRCGGIYKSWVRSVVKHVAKGKWRPWSLDRLKRDDPQLYDVVISVVGEEG